MSADDRPLLMIGVAAQLAGMHPQTLRMYERRGYITPRRSPGGTRLYSHADVARLRQIQELSEAGFNHVGIERIMRLERELQHAMDRVRTLEAQMLAQASAALAEMDALRRTMSTEIVPARRGGPPAPIVHPVIPRQNRYGR